MSGSLAYINWGVSSFFGWGVYGLNLALQWSVDDSLAPVGCVAMSPRDLALDPLRAHRLRRFLERSSAFQAELAPHAQGAITVAAPCLNAYDERFEVAPAVHGVSLSGAPSLAVTFFETAQMTARSIERAAKHAVIVAGSTWNAEVLRAHGLANVRTVIQGVDPTLFHPAPRAGYFPDRFLVFSGGKLERRKGQDLVLAAFRRFAERRPDALLVTAWHSPWPESARSLDQGAYTSPVVFDERGRVDVPAWARENGVGARNVLDLGLIPNAQTPPLLREMDVALFPNRAEGGTNLVAMECMACGVPTILSSNTGHRDLIGDETCFPLLQQSEGSGREAGFGGVAGWGESDVDEIVSALERVYRRREEARAQGLRGARLLTDYSWARTASAMKEIVLAA